MPLFAGIGVWSHSLRLAGWPDDKPVWTGSCPCQPFSAAGKGDGFADERHLWPHFFHLISERRPQHVLGEQVASGDANTWFDLVQADRKEWDTPSGLCRLRQRASVRRTSERELTGWPIPLASNVKTATRTGSRCWRGRKPVVSQIYRTLQCWQRQRRQAGTGKTLPE